MLFIRLVIILIFLGLAGTVAAGYAHTGDSSQTVRRNKKLKTTTLTGAVSTRKVSVRAHVRKGRPVRAHVRKIRIKP
jgi:hypothetical protein